MKNQIKKLSLTKKTISNLDSNQLNSKVGGNPTNGKTCDGANTCYCYWTQKGRTCRNCDSW